MFRPNLPSGFSLIEILIVVAIVGILVTIAYPSYEQKMQRVHAMCKLYGHGSYTIAVT